MATSDQLQRAAAAEVDFEVRLYAGGMYGKANLDAITVGAAYDPTASTTTTNDVDRDSSSIPVSSTTDFPSSGTIVVAPTDGDEHYEVIYYGSKTPTTFDDLVRGYLLDTHHNETEDEVVGIHASGATVSEWIEITDWVTDSIDLTMEVQDGIGSWSANVRGWNYNSRVMARDRAILGMWRFRPASGVVETWTSWTVGFIGFVQSFQVTDDYVQAYTWMAKIKGVEAYLGLADAPAMHFGATDLASGASVSVSSVLSDPYREYGRGEYIGFPELTGDYAVDGDISTLWISENAPSRDDLTPVKGGVVINEIMLEQRVGLEALQFVEIYCNLNTTDEPDMKAYSLVNQNTIWEDAYGTSSKPKNNFIDQFNKGRPLDNDGSWGLWVSNRTVFERYFQLLGGHILDWREKQRGSFSLSTVSGFVAVMQYGTATVDAVWWGGGAVDKFGVRPGYDGHGPGWSGARLTVPAAGNTLRRKQPGLVTTPSADAFEASNNPTPGGYDSGDDEWISVDLGNMGHKLTQELASDETDEMALDDVLGFTASGYVQIDAEIISYSARDDHTNQLTGLGRGEGGTTPAVHPVDSVVKQYEGGVAYDCWLVGAVRWRRKAVYDENGILVLPQTFAWFWSAADNPIMPDSGQWLDDWTDDWAKQECHFEGDAHWQTEQTLQFETPIRARHVLLMIREMTDGGRAKINELNAWASTRDVELEGSSDDILEHVLSGEIVKHVLVDRFGLDSSAVTLTDEGRLIPDLWTTKATYRQVLSDILEKTACALYFDLDGTVEHRYDPFYPLRSLPEVETTWDRENAREIDMSGPVKHNVSQVVLRAVDDTDTGVIAEVRYPAKPLALGSELVVEEHVVSVVDALLRAERRFNRENGPLAGSVVPVGIAEFVRPGQRHIFDWTLDTEATMLSGRNFVVQSVTHSLDLGKVAGGRVSQKRWDTTITLEELLF